MYPVSEFCLDVSLKTVILSLRPRLRVLVPPSCVHRDKPLHISNSAFTPDATCVNKSRYSHVVGRSNIFNLLTSQQTRIRVMGGASARRLQSRCEMVDMDFVGFIISCAVYVLYV